MRFLLDGNTAFCNSLAVGYICSTKPTGSMTAQEYQALKEGKDRSVVNVQPQEDHAARLRGHLRAMGDYYDIPKERTEEYIKKLPHTPNWAANSVRPIADHLTVFAKFIGIPEGPASFYIRQQQLSQKI